MRNFWFVLVYLIILNGGNVWIKKKYLITDITTPDKNRRWFESKWAAGFFLCWLFVFGLTLFFIVNVYFIYSIFSIVVFIEIWLGVEQYRHHKENRQFLLNWWNAFCSISLLIFVIIFYPVVS